MSLTEVTSLLSLFFSPSLYLSLLFTLPGLSHEILKVHLHEGEVEKQQNGPLSTLLVVIAFQGVVEVDALLAGAFYWLVGKIAFCVKFSSQGRLLRYANAISASLNGGI